MNFYNIFFDTIENFFDFLIIDLFIKNHGYKSYYKHILRPIFLTFRIFYAIITFPNWFVYIKYYYTCLYFSKLQRSTYQTPHYCH